MRHLFSLLIFLGLAVVCAQSQPASPADPEVLRVGEHSLNLLEFDQRFEAYAANLASQQGIPLTAETRPLLAALRPAYLDQLATQFVLLEEGERRGLAADPAYVEEQVAGLRGSFASEEDFRKGLERAGFASEALLKTLIGEAQLLRQTVEMLRQDVVVRDYQIDLYYQANASRYRQEEQVCARHILVGSREEAQALAEELENGADFASLARDNSTDTGSAERGGDLGCFPRGMMVGPFEEAAFGTPVGKVSGIVQSRFGYHLVLPYDHKEASQVPLGQVEDEVRTEVENLVLQKVIDNLRDAAVVEVNATLVAPAAPQGKEPQAQ